MPAVPEVSVVVATHGRRDRLSRLLDALEAQDVGDGRFEAIVVDDASPDGTPELLAERAAPWLRTLRFDANRGPAAARQAGWQAARAPLVAFTDDDCEPVPGWLGALLAASEATPGAVVMGRTDPEPDVRRNPFSRTVIVHQAGPPYETCNILYPRALLERLQGFDTTIGAAGGEDTDLGWRAEQAGAPVVFAPDAQVHHAVFQQGPVEALRYIERWNRNLVVLARHPDLRRRHLHRGVFASPAHEHLLRALAALLVPRRLRLLRLLLARPYVVRLCMRRTGPLLAPWIVLRDAAEIVVVARAAIRERIPVL